jgi:hypothetical protein
MTEPAGITKIKHNVKFDDYTIVMLQDDEYCTIFLGGNKPVVAPGDQSEDGDVNILWTDLPQEYRKYLSEFSQYKDFAN